jgi:2,3-bisphosphoglycerate-dependent phosphoglycerate mutase
MPTLILMRHGQSAWNLENRFTGWWDVSLTNQGIEEARAAGRALLSAGFKLDIAYTSLLTRAIHTLNLALEQAGQLWLPVIKDWRLNERHYGGLTGLNKAETMAKHGEEQVFIWRRSFDVPPPLLDPQSEFDVSHDRRYAGIITPKTESLKDTIARVLPVWNDHVAIDLRAGKSVIMSAHGNSLRALVKHLDSLSDAEITSVEIPTGSPLIYHLDDTLVPLEKYYLKDRISG